MDEPHTNPAASEPGADASENPPVGPETQPSPPPDEPRDSSATEVSDHAAYVRPAPPLSDPDIGAAAFPPPTTDRPVPSARGTHLAWARLEVETTADSPDTTTGSAPTEQPPAVSEVRRPEHFIAETQPVALTAPPIAPPTPPIAEPVEATADPVIERVPDPVVERAPDPVIESTPSAPVVVERTENVTAPIARPPETPKPSPVERPAQTRVRVAHDDEHLADHYERPDMPSAVGRLVAVVVTLGLGWALVAAFGIWIISRFVG